MTTAHRLAVLAAIAATALAATACTSRSRPITPSSSAPVQSSSVTTGPSSPDGLSTAPSSPEGSAPTATASVTPPPSQSNAASPSHSSGGTDCPTAGLTLTAQRGSGASGQQFATLTFTNTTRTACPLRGFPGVSLRSNNSALGQPAGHATGASATVTLAPGHSATSQLTVDSTCNAASSNAVRVYPPNQTTFVDLPITLRGCSMVVTPVSP
jgi:hypothetical protein